MPFPTVDSTTLTNVSGNLDVGDVADPALRLAYFQYINSYLTTIISQLNSTTALSSGSESIGAATISGVAGNTPAAQIADLRAQILALVGAAIPSQTIVTSMIQDNAVTYDKMDSDSQADLIGGDIYLYKNYGGF
jgi:hypothetical protein